MANIRNYRSRCGELETSRTAENLVKYYESLGYQSERDKNPSQAHNYFQHAEYYKHISKNDA